MSRQSIFQCSGIIDWTNDGRLRSKEADEKGIPLYQTGYLISFRLLH